MWFDPKADYKIVDSNTQCKACLQRPFVLPYIQQWLMKKLNVTTTKQILDYCWENSPFKDIWANSEVQAKFKERFYDPNNNCGCKYINMNGDDLEYFMTIFSNYDKYTLLYIDLQRQEN